MIEIMCRDNSVSDDELTTIASTLEQLSGVAVDVLSKDSIRAMVFWGPDDVYDYCGEESDMDDDFATSILVEAEPSIHMAMLKAGGEVLQDFVSKNTDCFRDT